MAWLRIKKAAGHCDVSERKLRQWLKEGLRHSRIDGTLYFRETWLDLWLENHEEDGSEVDRIVDELENDLHKIGMGGE